MRIGIRHAVLLLAGIAAVLLTVAFTAYGLTTYDSIRGIVGDISGQSEQMSSLQDQYLQMSMFFSENKGDTFTYHYGGLPLSVSKADVARLDEQKTIDMVLDIYASNIYHVRYQTGIMGSIGSIFNAGGNKLYTIMTFIMLLIFLALAICALLPVWEDSMSTMLKEEGIMLIVICILAFIVFLIAPGIVKSIVWDSIPNIDNSREIVRAIESRIVSSLLVNNIILVILGAFLYAAGHLLEKRGISATPAKQDNSRKQAPPPRGQQKGRYKGL